LDQGFCLCKKKKALYETSSGKEMFSGEGAPGLIGEAPRAKQKWLELWNK